MTQFSIFAIGVIVKDVLEKDRKLWLVLQNIVNLLNILKFHNFGVICDHLLGVDAGCFSVYTDSSLSGLETSDMKTGAAVFFENIGLGLSVEISKLVSSTITKLQAITLVLNRSTAGDYTYFIKTLHYWLPVAVCKHLYTKNYLSVVYLFCEDIEISNYTFSYLFNSDVCVQLLDTYAAN
ncbi:hypothetical protein G9A89_001654 [Geosiphon pyriformis]|nr:hypothetical protein G9A89_001654 [Geosiphon pyriformis]